MTAKWRAAAIVCVMTLITGSECLAQSVPVSAGEDVFVRLIDSKQELRGRLVHLDASTLSIEDRKGRLDLPLTRVSRVDKKERDSLVNGAMFGLLYVGACTLLWCSQGRDTETSPADVIGGALVGAAVGAMVDAAITKRVTIYTGPAPRTSAAPAASIRVTLRF